jgi:hypothetical protein
MRTELATWGAGKGTAPPNGEHRKCGDERRAAEAEHH